ncbi:MAG: cohesin domain-containing protein [Saprospiraceae bacterium]
MGAYHLLVTDANGQTQTGDFYVSGENNLEVDFTADADQCDGLPDGAITLLPSGGSGVYAYNWSNGATTAQLTNLAAGSYTVTVLDAVLGCSQTLTIEVPGEAPFNVFYHIDRPSCSTATDGAIDVSHDASGAQLPLMFAWSNGADTEDISGLAAGIYTLTITDAGACSKVVDVLLTATDLYWEATVQSGNCTGGDDGQIILNMPDGDFTFIWSNGATEATVAGLPAGAYSVTVTEVESGCTATQIYTLADQGILASYNYTCYEAGGQSWADIAVVVWTNNDAPYTFHWSNGEIQTSNQLSSITVPGSGVYDVTITSASGCVEVLSDITFDCGGVTPSVVLALEPTIAQVATGDNWCADVTVQNFDAMTGFQFTIQWDEDALAFTGLQNLSVPGLDLNDFNTNLTDDGLLTVVWLAGNVNTGETLPDDSVLFSICFDVIATGNTATNLLFPAFPTPVEFVSASAEVVAVQTEGCQVNINGGGNEALTMGLGNVFATGGSQVCVPLQVSGFSSVGGMQFTMQWDPQALIYTGVANSAIPGLSSINFGALTEIQEEGVLRVLWFEPTLEGISLPDESTLFEVCFVANGLPGTYPVVFTPDPLPAEVVSSSLAIMPVSLSSGSVTIGVQQNDAAILQIASVATLPGEQVCVPVEAIQFYDMLGMQFSMLWDTDLLDLEEVNFPPGSILNETHIYVPPAGDLLTASWINADLQGVTVPHGTILMELCFTAQATEGEAAVVFANQPTAIEFVQNQNGPVLIPFMPVNGIVTITADGLIWPGDTNTDEIVNHFDLLHIGLAYGTSGPPRPDASINWYAQYSDAWGQETPASGIDFAHIDTDGNGMITAQDTAAIAQNWGQIADMFTEPDLPGRFVTGVPFYVLPDTVEAGAHIQLPVLLGTDDHPANGVYGVAFTIEYDPIMIESGSVSLSFNGWMGTQGEDLLAMYRDYPGTGRVEVALVRTDGQDVSGSGAIAELSIIMEDVILRGLVDVEVPIRISEVRLIDVSEVEVPTAARETITLVLNVTNTQEIAALAGIQIMPNPATDFIQVVSETTTVNRLLVRAATGALLINTETTDQRIDLQHLPAGVYYLELQTPLGVAYRKLILH